MGTEQKVAVITGASQGIGAALVKAYRDRNYRVVATARSIKPSNDDDVLAVAGDIADPKTAERVIVGSAWPGSAASTRWSTTPASSSPSRSPNTPRPISPRVLGVNLAGFFHITQLAIAEMEKQGGGHVVQDHDKPGRSRHRGRAFRAGVADQGRPERRHQVARDRVRQARHPRERGLARHHQDADASARDARGARRAASGRPHGRESRISSMRSCISKGRAS